MLLDFVIPLIGSRQFGASKYGIWGCGIGAVLGAVFLPPLGILIGPFLGGVIGELVYGKTNREALRAGLGAFLGFLAGTVISGRHCYQAGGIRDDDLSLCGEPYQRISPEQLQEALAPYVVTWPVTTRLHQANAYFPEDCWIKREDEHSGGIIGTKYRKFTGLVAYWRRAGRWPTGAEQVSVTC
jgi:hypothetical protein